MFSLILSRAESTGGCRLDETTGIELDDASCRRRNAVHAIVREFPISSIIGRRSSGLDSAYRTIQAYQRNVNGKSFDRAHDYAPFLSVLSSHVSHHPVSSNRPSSQAVPRSTEMHASPGMYGRSNAFADFSGRRADEGQHFPRLLFIGRIVGIGYEMRIIAERDLPGVG